MLKHTIMFAAVAGLVFALGATASADIVSNLDARWEFENALNCGYDMTGNGNQGTLLGGAMNVVDAQRLNVLDLTATGAVMRPNDIGDINSESSGVPLGADWTIGMWFKDVAASESWRPFASGAAEDHILLASGTNELGTYPSGGWYSSGYAMTPVLTGWHHIAAVGSGGATDFYIDGAPVGTAAGQATLTVKGIGNHPGMSQGSMDYVDDVRIYGRALTAGDVLELYNAPIIPEPASALLLLVGLPFVMRRKRR